MNSLHLAFKDFTSALRKAAVWQNLGLLEVKQRYQRSVLGPWWVSISMLIYILVLGTVFSRIFKINYEEYMPYFSAGYLLWLYISSCLNESTDLFRQNSGFIKQIYLPFSLYIFKFMTRNILIFLHNFLAFVLVLVYFHVPVGYKIFLAIPGFLILSINLYWMVFLTAIISTRFRDMVPIVMSFVQIVFFVTPISWDRGLIGTHSKIIKFNPFVYLIDIVRSPLLGKIPALQSYSITLVLACLGLAMTFFVFSKIRTRIPFWVD